jgi:hypothetical protein
MKVRVLGKGMVQTNRDHGQKRVLGITKRTGGIILELDKRLHLPSRQAKQTPTKRSTTPLPVALRFGMKPLLLSPSNSTLKPKKLTHSVRALWNEYKSQVGKSLALM